MAATVVVVVVGCAQLPLSAPWVDSRHEGGTDQRVGTSTLDKPVICFADDSQRPVVQAMAEVECARTQRVPVLVGVNIWQCRALTPQRANFRCESPADKPDAGRLGGS